MIHGDSAGAGSVAFHITAYGGRDDGLFVGGIAESPFVPTHRTVRQSEFQFDRFAAQLNCSHARNQLRCLRSLTTAEVQSADVVSTFPGGPDDVEPNWYFLPVVDGTFSPDYLYNMFERGQVNRVPLIVGDDTDEGTGFSPNVTTSKGFLDFIKANYPHLSEHDLGRIKSAYPLGDLYPNHAPWFTPAAHAYGESTFICPGIEMIKSMARHLSPHKSWNYRYNVMEEAAVAAGLGVPHVTEKPAIFGPGNAGSCGEPCTYTGVNAPMVPIVMNYWISFIRTLNPNTFKHPSAPQWKSWGCGERLRFQLDATGMEHVSRAQMGRCHLWESLAETSQQ